MASSSKSPSRSHFGYLTRESPSSKTFLSPRVPSRVTSRKRNQQVLPPSQADELTAEQVERIFAVMHSDEVKRLYKIMNGNTVFEDNRRKRDHKGRFLSIRANKMTF